MVDPITAIGLASNILQFVQIGYSVVVKVHQLNEAVGGATDEQLEAEAVAEDLQDLCAKLSSPLKASSGSLSQDEVKLRDLAQRCYALAPQLLEVLESLKVKSQGSTRRRLEAVQKAVRALMKGDKIKSLQNRLASLQKQITAHLLTIMRSVQPNLDRSDHDSVSSDNQSSVLSKLRELEVADSKLG